MKKAFTLIELLVVISIIALLMSVLMPALGKAKELAKDVICKSNLHQWSIVYATYVSQNDDKFYTAWHQNANTVGGGHEWIYLLQDQFQTYDVAMCPNANKVRDIAGTTSHWGDNDGNAWVTPPSSPAYGHTWGSYGINDWVGNTGTVPPDRLARASWQERKHKYWATTSVSGAKNVPLFRGALWLGARPADTDLPPDEPDIALWDDTDTGYGKMCRFLVERHKGGDENTLFVDLSARSVGIKELWTLKWHKEFDTRNYYTLAGTPSGPVWPTWMEKFKDY